MIRLAAATLLLMAVTLPASTQPASAQPARVQTAPVPLPAHRPLALPAIPMPGISGGHALALGVGMFAGAVMGSALINGGALAATIGAAAGLSVGHWVWTEQGDSFD